jgi:hypothetical protein
LVLETVPGFGNRRQFWKLVPVLETGTSFGNSPHFPELPLVLETVPGFGNLRQFWKLVPVLETGTSFGNSPHFPELPPVLETVPASKKPPWVPSIKTYPVQSVVQPFLPNREWTILALCLSDEL